jgi:HEAT repeat protein
MRGLVFVAVVSVLLSGCGQSPPTMAGGKPVSHWVEALRDPDAKVRKTAAFKLGNVGPADAAVLPALVQALKDRDPAVRRESILALVKCGPEAGQAIPVLTDLQQRDRDPQVRSYAARAVQKLGTELASARD